MDRYEKINYDQLELMALNGGEDGDKEGGDRLTPTWTIPIIYASIKFCTVSVFISVNVIVSYVATCVEHNYEKKN